MEDEEMAECANLVNGSYLSANAVNYNYTGNVAGINPSYSYSIRPVVRLVEVIWNPKEDITNYELAKAFPLMSASCNGFPLLTLDRFGKMIKDLGFKTLRHFDIHDSSFEGIEWDKIK